MHVKLHLERLDPTKNHLEIDGVDFTHYVLANDFIVEQVDTRPMIRMTLAPKSIAVTGDMDIVLTRIAAQTDPEDGDQA